MIRNFFSTPLNFVFKTVVVTKLLVFGILFSVSLIIVLKTVTVTRPLVSGISFSTCPISYSKFCLSVLY